LKRLVKEFLFYMLLIMTGEGCAAVVAKITNDASEVAAVRDPGLVGPLLLAILILILIFFVTVIISLTFVVLFLIPIILFLFPGI